MKIKGLKFSLILRLFILTIFFTSIYNFFSITANAQMQNFDGCYQATTPPDHYENRYSTLGKTALTSVANGLVFDGAALALCNTDCTTMFGGNLSLLDKASQGCAPGFVDVLVGKDGRTYESRGGLAFQTAKLAGIITSPAAVPTNLALFTGDTVNHNIFGATVYAQSQVDNWFFSNLTYELWKILRNIAISFIALAVGIVALTIIFKKKIPSQYSVTIFNSIGSIIIAIFFILLSYPMFAVIWNAMENGNRLSTSIFADVFVSLTGIEQIIPTTDETQTYLNPFEMIKRMFYFGESTGPDNVAIPILAIVGTILAVATSQWFIILLALIILFSIVIWATIYVIIWLRMAIRIMTLTLASPLVGLVSILPGKQQTIWNVVRRGLAEVVFSFYMGFLLVFGIGGYYFLIADNVFWADSWYGAVVSLTVPLFFSWYILLNTGKVRMSIYTAFNATQGPFESLMSLPSGGEDFKGKKDFKPRR